jgi:hypothetical protein
MQQKNAIAAAADHQTQMQRRSQTQLTKADAPEGNATAAVQRNSNHKADGSQRNSSSGGRDNKNEAAAKRVKRRGYKARCS